MKVLAIGNSFSDDSMEYLYQILDSLGEKDISLGNLYIGGCSIDTHVNNARTDAPAYDYRTNTDGEWHTTPAYPSVDALRAQEWEFVSMQQASYESGLKETYKNLPELIAFARKNARTAKFFWNMTWAYQGNAVHAGFANYDNDQMKMYNGILGAVQSEILPKKEIEFIVPVGTAIQNARATELGDTLTRDGYHLSIPLGRYIAGLAWARMLTGKSVRGIAYAPEGLSEEEKALAIEVVEKAIDAPFEITK